MKPAIEFGGTDTDLQTARPDVWVGQPVPVSISGADVRKVQWTVAGDTFKEYHVDNVLGKSEVIRLSAAEWKKSSVTFHWVAEEGTRTVIATGQAKLGNNFNLAMNIEVHRPHVTINALSKSVKRTEVYIPGQTWMALTGAGGGVQFRAEGDISLGQFSWIQLVDITTSGGLQGEGLDSVYPYGVGTTTNDTPAMRVDNSSGTTANYIADFCIYLMWTSPEGGQVVPLRYLNWSVRLYSELNSSTGKWEIDQARTTYSIFNWDQTGADQRCHPTWTRVIVAI